MKNLGPISSIAGLAAAVLCTSFGVAAASTGPEKPACSDLFAERLERQNVFRKMALDLHPGDAAFPVFRPRITRATSARTLEAGLAYICRHLDELGGKYVVLGPNPSTNVADLEENLRQAPWGGFDHMRCQMKVVSAVDHWPLVLIIDAVAEKIETGTPANLRAWGHVFQLGEHRSSVRNHSVTVFAAYEGLPSPRDGKLSEIVDPNGRPVRMRLNDLTDHEGQLKSHLKTAGTAR